MCILLLISYVYDIHSVLYAESKNRYFIWREESSFVYFILNIQRLYVFLIIHFDLEYRFIGLTK